MPTAERKESDSRPILGFSAFALISAVAALAAIDIYVDHRRAIETAFDRLESLARIADEVISGRMRAVDLLLLDAGLRAREAATTPAKADEFVAYLTARAESLDEVQTIAVTDAAGVVRFSNLPGILGLSTADRPYYPITRENRRRLNLVGPLRALTGVDLLFAARAKPMADGAWDGAVVGSLPPAYFLSVLDTVRPAEGFAALTNAEGLLIARASMRDDQRNGGGGRVSGDRLSPPAAAGRVTRLIQMDSVADGSFLKVWRTTEHPELRVAVGWSESAVLAEWRRKSLIKLTVVGGMCFLAAMAYRRFVRHQDELRRERNIARRAEQEMLAGQRFIHAFADSMPDVVGYWDAGLRCRFANRTYLKLLNRTLRNAVGVHMRDLLGAAQYDLDLPYARAALRGESQRFERAVVAPDGETAYVWGHYIPDVGPAGDVIGFFALINDVTPLKRIELRLRAASARLSLAAAAAGVGVWEYDLRTREATWDDRMYDIYGLPPGDRRHAYAAWAQRIHPDDLNRVENAFLDAAAEGRDFSDEFRIITPSGEIRHIKTAAKPECDIDGSPERMIGVNWNITAIRENEAALAAARAAAESANNAKSEFLANMSHEIRTPINAILGLTRLLERTPLSDDQRQLLGDLGVSGRTLLSLISNILDFSRVEAGRLELETRSFSLDDLLCAVQAIMAGQARDKGLTLRLTVAPDAPRDLFGDSLRLQQVLTNLVGNAVKFTDNGEVAISVEAAERDGNRVVLKFTVADTGVGLPSDRLERLFDAFTQADTTTTRRYGGSGLGLAICKKLTTLMGGNIGAESQVGAGSRFWFTAQLTANEDESARARSPHAVEPRLAGLRLLVAEDNKINQDMMRRVLALEGADVVLVGDGAQAVARLAESREAFDVVLMDIQMPELDGCAATWRIRQELGVADLPIIALTAGALNAERERAYAAGMNDFITKPFDLDLMIQSIRRAVGRSPASSFSSAAADRAAARIIPGLNGEDALRRMGGDRELQDRVTLGFVEQMADEARRAMADWRQGAAVAAARRLHALKGAASNIGAMELAEAAARGEALLRLDHPPADETARRLEALDELLKTQCRAIEAVLGGAAQ